MNEGTSGLESRANVTKEFGSGSSSDVLVVVGVNNTTFEGPMVCSVGASGTGLTTRGEHGCLHRPIFEVKPDCLRTSRRLTWEGGEKRDGNIEERPVGGGGEE